MRCEMSTIASFSQRRVEGFNHISLLSLRPLNHSLWKVDDLHLLLFGRVTITMRRLVLPSAAPFKGPDIESVAPAAVWVGGAQAQGGGHPRVLGGGIKQPRGAALHGRANITLKGERKIPESNHVPLNS